MQVGFPLGILPRSRSLEFSILNNMQFPSINTEKVGLETKSRAVENNFYVSSAEFRSVRSWRTTDLVIVVLSVCVRVDLLP